MSTVATFRSHIWTLHYISLHLEDLPTYLLWRIIGTLIPIHHSAWWGRYTFSVPFFVRIYSLKCFSNYLTEAQELYKKYRLEIERLLAYFECKKESDLFIGVSLNSNSNDEAKDNFKLCSEMLNKIWLLFRNLFFNSLGLNHEDYCFLPLESF